MQKDSRIWLGYK